MNSLLSYSMSPIKAAFVLLVATASVHAQSTFEADFETTFPDFGYSYDFAGYGDPECNNILADDQVSSTFDVTTGPTARADYDTTNFVVPEDACYDYVGWGLGMGYTLPAGRQITDDDLSQFNVSFDASVSGFDPFVGGIEASLAVIFQRPSDTVPGENDELRIGFDSNNLGNVPFLPFLDETPQSLSYNLADFAELNNEFDFATLFGEVTTVLLQIQINSNALDLGLDADNFVTLDNVVIEGPFAVGSPGDFDTDGDVDGSDFLGWQRGESPNGIGSGDLASWQAGYGPPAAIAAVPEPGTLAGACLALALFASVNRR